MKRFRAMATFAISLVWAAPSFAQPAADPLPAPADPPVPNDAASTPPPAADPKPEAAPVSTKPVPAAPPAPSGATGDAPAPAQADAAATGPVFDPIVIVYAEYVLSLRHDATAETDWFHQFELPRAQAGVDASWDAARGKVLVEAVRSSSEGALVGIDGDSIVARFREAWMGVDAWDVLDVRGGLIPTLVLPAVESSWGLRAVAPTAMERAALVSPADLGALVRARLPKRWGWVGVEAANGDGYARRELNRGKNVEIAAEIHPLAFDETTAPLTLVVGYTSGSRGVGLAKSNRLNGALAWQGEWVRAGGVVTWADGVADASDRQALVLEGFLKVADLPPIPRLIVGANVAAALRDLDASNDVVTTITGAAGARIAPPLAAYFAVDGMLYGDGAAAALPARDDARFRVIGELSL